MRGRGGRPSRLAALAPQGDGWSQRSPPKSTSTDTMLWAIFTLIAAAAQTARNAMQRELTASLGTVGATHVRFLFGFPFAVAFLVGVLFVRGAPLPSPDRKSTRLNSSHPS